MRGREVRGKKRKRGGHFFSVGEEEELVHTRRGTLPFGGAGVRVM